MSLDDTGKIDMVLGPTRDAKLTLAIVDGVPHADENERFNKLVIKLRVYMTYLFGPSRQFAKEHPGLKPSDVVICVLSHDPPNEVMLEMETVRPHGDTDPEHQVRFKCFQYQPGKMPLPDYFSPAGPKDKPN
jgi:hypothetical protein